LVVNIKDVELLIEELVLEGFEPQYRYRIAGAVERELTRILAQDGIPSSLTQSGEMAYVYGGSFEMTRGGAVEAVGARVAQAIYGGLSQ
jgi:hypothetical protein